MAQGQCKAGDVGSNLTQAQVYLIHFRTKEEHSHIAPGSSGEEFYMDQCFLIAFSSPHYQRSMHNVLMGLWPCLKACTKSEILLYSPGGYVSTS